ncbi:hypothetical protein ABTY63_29935 [Streptomyces solisilvae]|uniref:hypothetical protein n=1 Tax=Streptomyces malaysiensis TaxID=92644 RepID=UPI003325CE3A
MQIKLGDDDVSVAHWATQHSRTPSTPLPEGVRGHDRGVAMPGGAPGYHERGEDETVNIEEKTESEELTKIRVELTVTEELIYEFPITLEVPPEVADDIEALTSHLAEHEDLWLDDLPIDGSNGYLTVNERDVDNVKVLPLDKAA